MPFLFAPALLLAGCHTPEQVRAEVQSSQSTARCQSEFMKSLGGLPVTSLGGPSVTNFGDAISVRLEAQPVDPNIIDAKIYSCDFEKGEMIHSGPA